MKGWAQFGFSLLVHSIILVFVFLGTMGLIGAFGLRWQWPVGLGLLLVGIVGFAKRKRWGAEHQVSFLSGLVVAAVGFVAFWHYVSWSLSHPVGPPPPFGDYIKSTLAQPEGLLLTIAPVVLMLVASAVGYQVGKWFDRGRMAPAT